MCCVQRIPIGRVFTWFGKTPENFPKAHSFLVTMCKVRTFAFFLLYRQISLKFFSHNCEVLILCLVAESKKNKLYVWLLKKNKLYVWLFKLTFEKLEFDILKKKL
jgi:uncharacterized membrane protein